MAREVTPAISVIVPVYRAADYIADCVAAIAAQELAPHEVLFVDDGCDDGSIAIATRAAAAAGLPARVLTQPARGGAGAARNAGVRAATGELVWFCDADDTADPRFLSTLAARLHEDGSTFAMSRTLLVGPAAESAASEGGGLLVGSPAESAGGEGGGSRAPLVGPLAESTGGDGGDCAGAQVVEPVGEDAVWDGVRVAEAVLRNELRGYLCNKLLPLALLRERPIPEGVIYEDLDVVVALALRSARVSLCAAPLYRYRAHATSASRVFSERTFDLLAQQRRLDALLDADGRVGADARVVHRYAGVILPLANMGARAGSARALREAARRVRLLDLLALARAGEWRVAVAAGVLRGARRVYGAIVVRR